MFLLARLIGIVFIGAGLIFLLNPVVMKGVFSYMLKGKRIYGMGAVRIIAALILFIAAPQCRVRWVIIAIGTLPLAGGIAIFILGIERCRRMIKKWQNKSLQILRLMSFAPIIFGLLILYFA